MSTIKLINYADNWVNGIALDILDSLNSTGKMIGIISYVDALKERISVQINYTIQQV